MYPEKRYNNERDTKYPSLEPINFEAEDTNGALRASRFSGFNGDEWRGPPPSSPPCAPPYPFFRLELLADVDHLFVDQKVELLEAVTGFKFRNKYSIKNNLGQKLLVAVEETNFCGKVFCGNSRSLTLSICDTSMNEVLILKRPATCCVCCLPMDLQKLEAYAPPDTFIGSVEQEWNLFLPKFRINNEAGDCVLRMDGPFFASSFLCGDRDYEIYSKDRKLKIGKISKHWGGFIKEFYTDADNFGISFPMDLDVRMKAVLLGACFLIDFMYYEH